LVEIGSVFSEEKIFFLFHPPFFLFWAWWPPWLAVGITGHNFGRGSPKDHSTKVWLQLAEWFLRRRLKCEMLTDGRKVMTIARPGELKMIKNVPKRNNNNLICKWYESKLVQERTFSD
jgi:hypothetical protein